MLSILLVLTLVFIPNMAFSEQGNVGVDIVSIATMADDGKVYVENMCESAIVRDGEFWKDF